LKPVDGKPGTFKTAGVARDLSTPRDVELSPFYRLHHRTYSAYWDLLTPAEYDVRVAEHAAERERQRALEAATIAAVTIGDADAERRMPQQGEESTIVRVGGRAGRRAAKWFSYELDVDPARSSALVVTYNSDSRRARSFEILVDGRRLAEQTIPESSES